jgi:AraC-like DNA-binding protein
METLQNDPRIWPNVWLRSIFTEEGETGWRTCGKQKTPETYGHAINQLSVMSLFLVNLYNQDAELRKQEIENRSLTENVTEYINQHYADSLTIDQLAEQFFVSKYHLMHEFSQKTGTSIYRYLMQQRLHAVCELLEQGTVPNEAYLLCGFKDYANFYRAFRSAYGQSPREYARAHRKAKARTTKFCF